MITGKKNTKKPTIKEMAGMIGALMVQIEQLKIQVYNGDKALDEYMDMNGDKDAFIKFLEKKYPLDDKDNEKTESK
tara:strand:- start:925 stop:1152 length:228 start_codon:yes stop_codon:yes gene_type:complete